MKGRFDYTVTPDVNMDGTLKRPPINTKYVNIKVREDIKMMIKQEAENQNISMAGVMAAVAKIFQRNQQYAQDSSIRKHQFGSVNLNYDHIRKFYPTKSAKHRGSWTALSDNLDEYITSFGRRRKRFTHSEVAIAINVSTKQLVSLMFARLKDDLSELSGDLFTTGSITIVVDPLMIHLLNLKIGHWRVQDDFDKAMEIIQEEHKRFVAQDG